jgi:radical SAM-linked protein
MNDCHGCGFFAKQCLSGELERSPVPQPPPQGERAARVLQPVKYRLKFRKEGLARFVGHLDLVDILVRALRRAGVQLAYSQGYHPMPKVELPAPLPLGVEGLEEWVEFQAAPLDRMGLLARLKGMFPAGLTPEHLYQIPPSSPPLSALGVQVYQARLDRLDEVERREAESRLAAFDAAAEWPVTKKSKGENKTYDLKSRVLSVSLQGDRIEVHLRQGGFMDFVGAMFPGGERDRVPLARLRFEFPPG